MNLLLTKRKVFEFRDEDDVVFLVVLVLLLFRIESSGDSNRHPGDLGIRGSVFVVVFVLFLLLDFPPLDVEEDVVLRPLVVGHDVGAAKTQEPLHADIQTVFGFLETQKKGKEMQINVEDKKWYIITNCNRCLKYLFYRIIE